MSLENPTIIEKGLAIVKTYRIWFIIGGLVIVLLLVWWAITAGENWYGNRQIDKLKTNVNTALQDVNAKQQQVNQDKVEENRAVENVKIATNQYVEAVNATNAARAETNRALTNLANAVNSNIPVGVNVDQVRKQLDDLDR
jgi:uncharacterized protein YjcR